MRLSKGTWVVTLLLAGLTVAVASKLISVSHWNSWIALVLAIVASFLVMPPLWAWLVERRARPHLGFAALAGALGAFFALEVQLIARSLMYARAHGRPEVNEGVVGFTLIVTLTGVPVAGAIGVLLGVAVGYLQRRLMPRPATGVTPNGHASDRSRPEGWSVLACARGTWLATLLFLTPLAPAMQPSAFFAIADPRSPLVLLILTPALWWTLVARHRPVSLARGVMAGMAIPALFFPILTILPPEGADGSNPLAAIGVMLVVSVPLGAALGALTALLQKSVPSLGIPAVTHEAP